VSTHYVSARWTVKPGREEEFVTAFEALALWAELNHPEGGTARLLHSIDEPSVYVGMWEFPGAEAIERWRRRDVVEHMDTLGRSPTASSVFEPASCRRLSAAGGRPSYVVRARASGRAGAPGRAAAATHLRGRVRGRRRPRARAGARRR
jgi:heme-degrading monooxygenase HmoA